jgi:5S rRNA maturation endonuclease (ribonuclease M5)
MATLMNVNDQAMPMGDNTGAAGDGQTGPKRHYKHIGELADESKAKVVIMYRTVPGEADNCLVVGTKFLPDMYHNALMKAVESEGGQDADEFADYASRQTFPDGTNMLSMLHNDNYIKKFKTNQVMVTYGNDKDGRILLNKLNEMIAKEKGISVKDLAKDPDAPAKKTTKKADAKKTTAKE